MIKLLILMPIKIIYYKILYLLKIINSETYKNKKHNLKYAIRAEKNKHTDINAYVNKLLKSADNELFVQENKTMIDNQDNDPFLLAYYLTQFHQTEINNKNFGKGFTEWTNVAKARPQYEGHYEPHIPIDVGFYDLSHVDVMYRQVELAKKYGIRGFCFYYYWFSGQRVLEKPLFNFLNNKDLNFPFCLFWANESWESRWFGGNKKILIEHRFDITMVNQYFNDILPFFRDERYIKIDNKPFFIIYHPNEFKSDELKIIVEKFNELAMENEFDGIYFCGQGYGLDNNYVKECGLDGIVEFSPCGVKMKDYKNDNIWINPDYMGHMYNVKEFIDDKEWIYATDYTLYKGVFCSWDNTPRNSSRANIYMNTTPELYKRWLKETIKLTRQNNKKENQFIFINAWNEWGEGAHLEPDIKYGYAYLQATRDAIEETR